MRWRRSTPWPTLPRLMTRARPTRGKTRPHRLRWLDTWLLEAIEPLGLAQLTGPCLDAGFGEHPHTTVEWFEALHPHMPDLEIVGSEIHRRRAAQAQSLARPGLRFVQGGFDLAETLGGPVRLIRAMNVLRQYRPHQLHDARARWGHLLAEGGWLIEGTCDGPGEIGCAGLWRRQGHDLCAEGLVLYRDLDAIAQRGFAPIMLRDWLPRDLPRGLPSKHPISTLFSQWTAAWQAARDAGTPRTSIFAETARRLALVNPALAPHLALADSGHLWWPGALWPPTPVMHPGAHHGPRS